MDPKTEMNAFDLRAVVGDLADLEGAKLNKAYQPGVDDVTLSLWLPGHGRQDLHVGVGAYAVRTAYRRDNPIEPPDFPMQLRKYLGGGTVTTVRQVGFDRILVVEFDTRDGKRSLVFELFSDGNAVLAEPAGILAVLRFQEFSHRTIRPGVEYQPPPMRGDPFVLDPDEIGGLLAASDRDLVRCLAIELDLGDYADEVVHRSGLEKGIPAPDADPDAVRDAIEEVLDPFRQGRFDPVVYRDADGRAVDVAPIRLEHLEDDGLDAEPADSVNEAFDRYFSHEMRKHLRTEAQKVRDERIDKLETRIEHQEAGIERLEDEADRERATAEAIYQNYRTCEQVLDALGDLRGVELRETVEAGDHDGTDRVVDVRPEEHVVVVEIEDLEGERIEAELRLDASVEENASWHYDRASHREAKADRAREALQDSRDELEEVREEGVEVRTLERTTTERKFWFEDYRWCLTSTGHVMVGGRDASSNDRVVKRYLESKDRYAHADISGAPSVVVKADGDPPPEEALEQAIAFSVAYSKAWSQGLAGADGYWVLPEQVSKSPESGEHLGKGAFVIRGTRHHVSRPVRAAVGPVEIEGVRKVMGGPVEAVRTHADAYVVLEPGSRNPNDVAAELADAFDADVEDVQKALPPGPSRIVEKVGMPA